MTFALVLIKNYGLNTSQIALLFGFCAAVNIFGSPIIGRLTDRLGYRNTMIWDTVVLFFVCILYGYSHQWFEPRTALVVVCLNYLLDAILSTTSLASNLYVRDISSSTDETTSTISTGISINHLISIATAPLGGWVWMRRRGHALQLRRPDGPGQLRLRLYDQTAEEIMNVDMKGEDTKGRTRRHTKRS